MASPPGAGPASEPAGGGGTMSYTTGVEGGAGNVAEQGFGQDEQQQHWQGGGEMWGGQSTPASHLPASTYPHFTMQGNIATGDTGMLYPPQATLAGGVLQQHLPYGMSEWHSTPAEERSESGWGRQLMSLSPCCPGHQTQSTTESMFPSSNGDDQYMWRWTRDGKLQLTCGQPVVPVPVIQEVHRRDKIIEVPQVDVLDAVKPKVFNQGVEHEVPVMQIHAEREDFDIKQFKYVETEVVVPIVTGFTHKFVPKWEIREVPRPIVKYVGKQEVIEVEVPQVKFVDRVVEREVVVDTVEKKVPKIIEVPKYVDTVKYVWTPVEKIVHVERFVPVFDVSLECPAPLIVPYPVQAVKEMPAVMVRKAIPGATEDGIVVEGRHALEVSSPCGTVRVPEEYIREYRRASLEEEGGLVCCGLTCELPPGMQMEPGARSTGGSVFSRSSGAGGGSCGGMCGEEAPPKQDFLSADEIRKMRGQRSPGDGCREGGEEQRVGDAFCVEEVTADADEAATMLAAAEAALKGGERLLAAAAEAEADQAQNEESE